MTSTFTDHEDRFRDNRLASGYTARGRGRHSANSCRTTGCAASAPRPGSYPRWRTWDASPRGSSACSTGDDALLDRNTLREMHRVHWLEPDGDTTYGLGFSVWTSDGDTFAGHGGSCPG